jgi:hypothetical protein
VSPQHRDVEDDHIGPGAEGQIDQRAASAGPPDRFRTVTSNKRWKASRGFDVGIHCALAPSEDSQRA